MVELREKLNAKDAMVSSTVQAPYATLGPYLSNIVENFRADINKSVSDAFLIGSIDA